MMAGLGRNLAVGGLALLAIPTALWIGTALSLHHHRWLWDPPPYPLRGVSRDVVIEASWQALVDSIDYKLYKDSRHRAT